VKVLLERDGTDPRNLTGLKSRALALSAGYMQVVGLIDIWTTRLRHLERFAVEEEDDDIAFAAAAAEDDYEEEDDGDEDVVGRRNQADDIDGDIDGDGENDGNGDGNEVDNTSSATTTTRTTTSRDNTDDERSSRLIPGLLPIVLNRAARRHDLAYRIICRHRDVICCCTVL